MLLKTLIKKNLLTTRKSVSNISTSLINCTSDSFELNIHQTNVQDSSSDFSLNKPILSLHCTANEPKLNLNNSEIIQNSKTSFVKDKIVDIENTLPETTARVTDSSTKSNVQNEYFPNDKALFDNILLSEQKKTDLIYLGPCQPTQSEIIEKEFPKIMNKNERQYAFDSKFYFYINKKDKLSESYKSSWLAYSPRNHYAYCHFCWIFGDNEAKKSSWYRGFTDWKHFKDSYSAHAQSKMHLRSSIATFNFKKLKDIKSSLSNQIDDEVKKWKEILTILFDTVRTLCASGLPLRGHRENIGIPGNHGIYLNIIDLISRHNSTQHRLGYFQACDNMINELEIRTTNFTSLHKLFDFLQPSKLKDITNDELDIHTRNLISKYKCFSTDLKLDIRTFIDCYFVDGVQCHENNEHSVYTYLKFITDLKLEDSIKEMQLLCRIFLTLPISTASAERSMSSLKKIKDYRRSTLSEDRLNDYAMLYIERDTAELIDLQSTIKIFSEKKARKGYKSELL